MIRPTSIALGVLAATWAVVAVREQVLVGRSTTFVLTEVAVGLLIVGAGLVVRVRRPTNRCWLLLTLAGFTWYVGVLEPASNRDVSLAAFALGRWYQLFLVWALLAYPLGRVTGRVERAIVATVAALLALRTLGRLLLHVPSDFTGCDCVRNRFLPVADDRWWRLTDQVYEVGVPIVIGAALVRLAQTWARSSAPGRRMLSPALTAGAVLAVAVGVEHVAGWNATLPRSGLTSYSAVAWSHALVAVSLALGFTRLRAARSAVVDLVADLDASGPFRLGDAIGAALGDPALRLLPWSDEQGAFVDRGGVAVEVDDVGRSRAVTRIERDGAPIAALVHDVALLEDPRLVDALATSVRLTLDNERLAADLHAQLAEVDASRARIVAAGDAARQRIERDLHDGAQQRLVTTAVALRLAEMRLEGGVDDDARVALREAVAELTGAIEELRNLARGIHPAVLTESGLGAALESLADRSATPVDLRVTLDAEPPADVAAAAYFSVAEAMTNVAKHAAATSMTVTATSRDGVLRVLVADDGSGGAALVGGTGLAGVADRVAAAGGTLSITSPTGEGTTLVVELPCES